MFILQASEKALGWSIIPTVALATMGLRESLSPYKGISGHENAATRLQLEYYWDNSV